MDSSWNQYGVVQVLTHMTECDQRIGYVIFDCVCLLLGAAECRTALTEEAAEAIVKASEPVLSKMEQYIVTLASEEASTTEKAAAVFNVGSTIWSGGCLGGVVSAWLGTLTVGDQVLYSATALATLLAMFATDGAAEIGVVAVELATAGWLVSDSVKCAEACDYS